MKLYEVPRGTRIRIEEQEFNFHKLDGMYSYCTDDDDCVLHITAFADVEIVEENDDCDKSFQGFRTIQCCRNR